MPGEIVQVGFSLGFDHIHVFIHVRYPDPQYNTVELDNSFLNSFFWGKIKLNKIA